MNGEAALITYCRDPAQSETELSHSLFFLAVVSSLHTLSAEPVIHGIFESSTMLTNHARMTMIAAFSVVVMIVAWQDASTKSESHSATDAGIFDIASKKLELVLPEATAQAKPLATDGQHSHHPAIVTSEISKQLVSGLNPKIVRAEMGSRQQSFGNTSDSSSSHRYAVGRLHVSVKTSTASEPYLLRVGRVAGMSPFTLSLGASSLCMGVFVDNIIHLSAETVVISAPT